MPELIPTATEAEWLEARRKGVTASEIAVVMGLSPWDSPYALYHRKLGILPPIEDNAAMERGRVLEPYVVEKFGQMEPDLYTTGDGRALYAHPERPWQMATPDRMVHETEWHDRCNCGVGPTGYYGMHERDCGLELGAPLAVLETKTASDMSEWGEPGTDEIPVHYRAQVLWQMDVMGVCKAYVAVLDMQRWQVREYVIEHAEGCGPGRNMLAYPSLACPACDDIVMMRDAGREFLGRIERQDPPDVDYRPATAKALRDLYPGEDGGDVRVRASLAISYQAAVKRYKAAERRKDEMTNAVLEVLRNNRRAIDPRTGCPIATRSVSHPKRIDVERLRSEQPAIAAEYTKPPKPEVKLTPAKPKKDKKNDRNHSE